MRWSTEHDDRLRALHGTLSIEGIANAMGITKCAVRGRITRLGISKRVFWTEEEEDTLRYAYLNSDTCEDLDIKSLAALLGRSEDAISQKAGELGVSNIRRKVKRETKARKPKFATKEELSAYQSQLRKDWHKNNDHPRGMAGKRHSEETKAILAKKSAAFNASLTDEQRAAYTDKALKSKLEKHGTIAPNVRRGTWKAGWRVIGGKRCYFRSRWEANYARYLEWLKQAGQIVEWAHEPETFWFDAIKRGVCSYKPDFRVWENDGTSNLHEVKGWMDSRSHTTLKRMAKYHQKEKIVLIRESQYNEIARKVSGLILDWEAGERAGRL